MHKTTMKNTRKLVVAALMAAFTCAATMIIKLPTPTFGYIHPGDGLVLLCGIILGPLTGALSAGIGSMFADIFGGYIAYAPATLIIKAMTAWIGGLLFHKLAHRFKGAPARYVSVVLGGLAGEIVMVSGYFLYESFAAAISSGGLTSAALAAGFAASAVGIPFNLVQGGVGIAVSLLLMPVLIRIEEIREWVAA